MENFLKDISSILAIDFDGVIHENSKGFHDGTIYDDPIPGTKEALEFLSKKYTLVICTCKALPERPLVNGKTGIELIWEWLKKYELDQYISHVTYKKIRAAFYIDDKAIKFDNWKDTLNDIPEQNTNISTER
jgi:histidinol phosphatase-like enzyme